MMQNRINRRKFMESGTLAAGTLILGSCTRQSDRPAAENTEHPFIEEPDAMELSKSMPEEQVFKLLDQKVTHYMELSNNCAQSAFLALSEQFGLGNKDMVKALTPIPGIAERGETCGAVTGALLALGLVIGRNNLTDWEGYRDSLKPANAFCDRFEEKMGSIRCRDIVKNEFGMELDLRKNEDLQKFQQADATHTCSRVVQTAVQIAADIILKT